jgi:DNA/RNA-binding domain of Phe-tRNA-synthetase-like protein
MGFVVDKRVHGLFPGLTLVAVVAKGVNNEKPRPAIHQALAETSAHLRDTWSWPNAQSHPYVQAWRRAFQVMGVSGKEFRSSVEALTRRALGGRGLPNINPVVDFYNSVSLRYLVPAGGWDLDDICGGEIVLRVTSGGEPFTALGVQQPGSVGAGEVVYTDQTEVITRHFVWRQAEKGKIRPATKNLFLVSEILAEVGMSVARDVELALVNGLREYFGASAQSAILTSDRLRWDWS